MYLSKKYYLVLTTDDWDNDMFVGPMETATSVSQRFCLNVRAVLCTGIVAKSTRKRCFIFTLKKIQRTKQHDRDSCTRTAGRVGFLERKNPSFTMCRDSFYTVSRYREAAGFNLSTHGRGPTSSTARAGQMLR